MQTLFKLGRTVATRGAVETMSKLSVDPITLLDRHVSGDWGDIHPEDRGENERALEIGARIFSVYGTDEDRLWVITEADRSSTTILRPEEY